MLENKRQNFHHSELPNMGEIVTLESLKSISPDYAGKWIVVSFNLCDNPSYSYSVGIHLVNLALLADRDITRTVSGFYCEVIA